MRSSVTMAIRMTLGIVIAVSLFPLRGASGAEKRQFFTVDAQIAQAAGAPAPPDASKDSIEMSLKEAIALALKNNLDVKIEGFNPLLREQDLTFEKAQFDPSAFLEALRADTRLPATLNFLSGQRRFSDEWDLNTGLRQKLPTGGTYELRFNNTYLHLPGSTLGHGYNSELNLSLTQPLLKNFGFEANETNIRIANNNQSISREQLRLRVSNVTTQVQNAYAELVFAIDNLGVQQRSLQLARDLVALNTARVRAGVAAPVEVTQAEAQEAANVQNVILAEKAVRDAEDTLKVVLNLPVGADWGRGIQPTYRLTFEPKTFDLNDTIRQALENRYEYKSAKIDIESKELSTRLARNQLLPDLAFTGSIATAGAGRNYGNNVDGIGNGDAISYSVGLVLTVPLGNRAAESTYTKARLTTEQARATLKQLELQIMQQVREGVRRVEAFARRVDANRAARVLAEEQLRVEQRRLEAGVSTTFNVLSFQRDLSAAEANELRAIADYFEALANLESVRGTVLAANQIEM